MLCSQSDVEALRQIDVTAEPDPTILALIQHAEGIVMGITSRRFDPVETLEWDVADLEQEDGVVYLPHYPVHTLTMVNAEGQPMVEGEAFHWQTRGKVYRAGAGTGVMTWDWQYNVGRGGWPWVPGTLITYAGGFDDPDDPDNPVPQDLRTVAAQITSMLFDSGAAGGPGIQSESLGGWSVSYRGIEDQLTKSQMTTLRRYAHRLPVIAY